MIANFTTMPDPKGLARYLLGHTDKKTDKQATILGSGGVRTDTVGHLIKDFELGCKLHPELGQSVLHISLSFNPDDASRMTDQKMRQVAEEYMDEMGMKGTQYLLVRHRDRPHQHLHIMANRVADDGHTIKDSNNFMDSKTAIAKLMVTHELSPAKGHRPHLQNPDRLRGKDLGRLKLRTALDYQLDTKKQTQRPDFLAAIEAKGITVREFHDKDGNVTGISFKMGGYACKGSALGPGYSSPEIDKRLAANQQKALEANSGHKQVSIAPDQAPNAAREVVAQALVPAIVPGPVGEELQAAVRARLRPMPRPTKSKASEGAEPVEVPLPRLVEAAVSTVSVQQSEQSTPVQVVSASPVLPASSLPVEASTDGVLGVGPVTPAEQMDIQGAEASAPTIVVPARTVEGMLVGTAIEGNTAASEGPQAQALPHYATDAEQAEWDRKLAAWEHQQAQQAKWERYEERYYDLREETTRKIAAADQEPYQSLPAFVVLMHTQGLSLLPAEAELPVRVVHQASGEDFPAEDILLAGRPFLDTVQAKAALAAEAAAAPAPEPVVDWEPRYQQYLQQRAAVLAHNDAVVKVNWHLEDHPNAAGVAAAIAMVQAPDSPLLSKDSYSKDSLLQNLRVELTRQQEREDKISWTAARRLRLEEVAKGRFGFAYTTAAIEARDELRYLRTPPTLPLQVGERRYLQPAPPNLTREQFAQQQQAGLDLVRGNVKAALAADFTHWGEFKSRVDRGGGIETTVSEAGKVAFRHKASGQTYRHDEVITNMKERYSEAQARGQAQEAKKTQKSAPVQSNDREISR